MCGTSPETFCGDCPFFQAQVDSAPSQHNYFLQNIVAHLLNNGSPSATPAEKDSNTAFAYSSNEIFGTRTCNATSEYKQGKSSAQCYQVPKTSSVQSG